MKKTMKIFLGLAIISIVLSSCKVDVNDQTGNELHTNAAYDKTDMVTIDGTKVNLKEEKFHYGDKALGFGITYTPVMFESRSKDEVAGIVMIPYYMILYYEPSDWRMTGVFRFPDGDENADFEFTHFSSLFDNIEEVIKFDNATYYYAYNDDISKINPSDEERETVEAIISEFPEFKNKLMVYPMVDTLHQLFGGTMTEFDTETLSGENFNQDMLKEYDLTMVNVWATWCGPCVEELPELSRLYGMLPENVNLISICTDGAEEIELTTEIYDSMGAEFEVLFMNEDLNNSVDPYIDGLPTTFFIDSNGMPIGTQAIVDITRSDLAEAYLEIIMDRLAMIGK